MRSRSLLTSGFISLVLLSGCGGGSSGSNEPVTPPPPPPPPPVNTAPEVGLSGDSFLETTTVMIKGDVTDDGEIASYLWQQVSGIPLVLDGVDTDTVSFVAPDVTQDQTIQLSLTVVDDEGASTTATAEFVILFAVDNQAPAITLQDGVVNEKATATITADVQDDGEIVSYEWAQVAGPEVTITDQVDGSLTFIAPTVTTDSQVSFQLNVKDNFGEESSAIVQYDVKSILLTTEIKGVAPANTGLVTISVAEQDVVASIDGTGNFSAIIQVDDDYSEYPVVATASSVGGDNSYQLRALIGTVNSLLDSAGSDGISTDIESASLRITPQSTASLAAIERVNGGKFESAEQLRVAQQLVDSSFIIPATTVIRLYSQYASFTPELELPVNINNTWELVTNLPAFNAYFANIMANLPAMYEQELATLLTEFDALTTEFLGGSLVGSLYTNPQGGSIRGGYQLNFSQNFKGELITSIEDERETGLSSFDWDLNGNGIEIEYSEPYQFNYYVDDVDFGRVIVSERLISSNMKLINSLPNGLLFTIQHASEISYPNGERQAEIRQSSLNTVTTTLTDSIVGISDTLEMGVNYHISIPDQDENVPYPDEIADVVTNIGYDSTYRQEVGAVSANFSGDFSTGGSVNLTIPLFNADGSEAYQQITGTWSINQNGQLELSGTGLSNSPLVISALAESANGFPMVGATIINPESQSADTGPMLKRSVGEGVADFSGMYMIGSSTLDNTTDYFWFELSADGTAITNKTQDLDNDGALSANEIRTLPGLWQEGPNNSLVLRTYYNFATFTYCTPETFDTSINDDCLLLKERVFEIQSPDVVTARAGYYVNTTTRDYINHVIRTRGFTVDTKVISKVTLTPEYLRKVDQAPVVIN